MTEINNKYLSGKIYFLMNDINHEIFYIGSSCDTLNNRLHKHKNAAFHFNKDYNAKRNNYIRLMNLENNKGFNDMSIHLIEDFPCNNKIELLERERYYIQLFKPSCNVFIPGRTRKEYRMDNYEIITLKKREYYTKNKDKYKLYRTNNQEKIKKYRDDNKEKFKNYMDNYKIKNKDIIKKKLGEKIKCECGEYYTRIHKLRHQKTQLHRDIIRMNELD